MRYIVQVLVWACAALLGGQVWALSPQEETVAKERIKAEHKANMHQCMVLTGTEKDACIAEAEGKAKVGKAEIDIGRKDSPEHRMQLAKAEADMALKVDQAKCEDKSGSARKECRHAARLKHEKKLNEAEAEIATQPAYVEAIKPTVTSHLSDEQRQKHYEEEMKRCAETSGDIRKLCEKEAQKHKP